MRRLTFGWVGVAVLLTALAAPVTAQTASPAIDKAVSYVKTQQQADGSFAGFGAGSTADAVIGLAAAGVNVATVSNGGPNAIEYMRSEAASADAGVAAKFVIALLVAGQSPTEGTNLVQVIEDSYDPATGQYGADVTTHAYAMLALVAAGQPVPAEAVAALTALQLPDGGWSYDGAAATGSDTNTTALSIQALTATAQTGDARTSAVEYLKSQQNDDGGFPYSKASSFGSDSDANSTALVIQAIVAIGDSVDAWARNGTSPLTRLSAFQNQSGAFRYQDAQPDDNALATYQAIQSLALKPLPLEGILIAQQPAPSESAAPVPSESAAPMPSESAAPAVPATVPAQLPNTGSDSPWLVLVALALVLLVSGLIARRFLVLDAR